MEVLAINTTFEVANPEPDSNGLFWQHSWRVAKIVTVVVSILGLLGNFLSYQTADYMPKSNSSVFMKYLAIWDSVAVLHYGVVPAFEYVQFDIFNKQVRHFPVFLDPFKLFPKGNVLSSGLAFFSQQNLQDFLEISLTKNVFFLQDLQELLALKASRNFHNNQFP